MKVMGDTNFQQSLIDFDKEGISDAVLKKLRKYTTEESFTPEAAGNAAKAAKPLCMWCCAMDEYSAMLLISRSKAAVETAAPAQPTAAAPPSVLLPWTVLINSLARCEQLDALDLSGCDLDFAATETLAVNLTRFVRLK
jgi:hypothetical protein